MAHCFLRLFSRFSFQRKHPKIVLKMRKTVHKKVPNSPIVWHFEVLLPFLSLRYGADLGLSRLVILLFSSMVLLDFGNLKNRKIFDFERYFGKQLPEMIFKKLLIMLYEPNFQIETNLYQLVSNLEKIKIGESKKRDWVKYQFLYKQCKKSK